MGVCSFKTAPHEIKEDQIQNKYPNKNKDAWYNQKGLKQKYKSIDSDIIPSINLNDFNNDKFYKLYANINKDRNIDQKNDTHWLIPNIFLVGRDPTYFVDDLISDGFTKFISLYEWGHNYKDTIMEVGVNLNDIELIAFMIRDFEIRDDKETVTFIDKLIENILNIEQQKIYMHCLGGHGRTGLISSLILQAIYGMDSETSLKFINHIHGCRHPKESNIEKDYYRMPESNVQFDQIRRLNKEMNKIYNKYLVKDS